MSRLLKSDKTQWKWMYCRQIIRNSLNSDEYHMLIYIPEFGFHSANAFDQTTVMIRSIVDDSAILLLGLSTVEVAPAVSLATMPFSPRCDRFC